VLALAVSETDLYVGGLFSETADGAVTNLNNIAKFDATSWSALPNHGLNSFVNALAVSGTDLYVGGGFTQTADGTLAVRCLAAARTARAGQRDGVERVSPGGPAVSSTTE